MYLVEMVVCSGVFYLLYRLLLEGKIPHSAARIYLLLSMTLALIIPAMELPILPAMDSRNEEVEILTFAPELSPIDIVETDVASNGGLMEWQDVALILYLVVMLCLIVRFVVNLVSILLLRQNSSVRNYDHYSVAMSSEVKEPFSFLRTVFVGENHSLCEQIMLHEQSHIAHNHTVDRILFEVLRALLWFNPFVHLIRYSIVQVHEWQADRDVLNRGYNIDEYRQIIFHQLFGYNPDITCGLNSNQTKKRFIMMTSFKKGKISLVRLFALIPIGGAMIFAFGSVAAEAETIDMEPIEQKNLVEIRKAGEEILLNKEPVTLEQLPELVKQNGNDVVTIAADNDVKMGKIADVKEAIRTAGISKITYQTDDAEQTPEAITEASNDVTNIVRRNGSKVHIQVRNGGKDILFCGYPLSYEQLIENMQQVGDLVVWLEFDDDVPEQMQAEIKNMLRKKGNLKTLYQSDTGEKVALVNANREMTNIKEKNLLVIEILADGTVELRGQEYKDSALKREIKHFVQNYRIYSLNYRKLHIGNPYSEDYSEFKTTCLTMPNGRKMACPVSKGVVCIKSVQSEASDNADDYNAKVDQVRDIVNMAYAELRNSLSRRLFNRGYDKLNENNKQIIHQAIPIQVVEIAGTLHTK